MNLNMAAVALLAAAGLGLVSPVAAAAEDDPPALIGLWQGIDSVDGSLRTFSIADPDGDGTLEVLAHDTYWALCDGPGGLEVVSGAIGADGVLRTTGTIACRSGAVIDVETTLTPQPDGQLLEEVVGQPFRTLLFRIGR